MAVVRRSCRTGLATMMASLVFIGGAAWAGAAQWGDTGTVAAVTASSRTIVVEIPRGSDSMTVGARVSPDAVLKADGRVIGLSEIKIGDRVRIEWSRGEQGDVAEKIIVLHGMTK
ncbi:MAG: hypothetical protein ACE5IQ_00245 [Candidatus Methylomirabilales bacterium]